MSKTSAFLNGMVEGAGMTVVLGKGSYEKYQQYRTKRKQKDVQRNNAATKLQTQLRSNPKFLEWALAAALLFTGVPKLRF